MSAVSPPFVLQAGSHPASTFRQMLQAITGSPYGSFAGGMQPTTGGGGHGVCSPTDLLTTQNGTPNMSVNVAGGMALVRGTENTHQGVYAFYNDGTVNLAISAADPTNPRRDAAVVRVRDAAYSGASNDVALVVVTGTPAASPSDPTLPANALVLDRVAVSAADTSITNAEITRLAPRAAALGGRTVCTSSSRPTGAALYEGLEIWETDTDRLLTYDGSGWVIMSEPWQAYTPTLSQVSSIGISVSVSEYQRCNGICTWRGRIGATAAGTSGTNVTLSLPAGGTTEIGVPVGSGFVYDLSATRRYVCAVEAASTTTMAFGSDEVATNYWGSTPSIGVASGDLFGWTVQFRMASRYS